MASYAVEVPRRTQKQVARLPKDVQDRIDDEAGRLLILEVWHRQRGYC